MKLYEIANDYLTLVAALENEEIDAEALEDTLEAIQGEIEIKADNIACVLKTLLAEVEAFKAEEARLAERRRKKEKAYDRLKDYLSRELLRAGIGKVETVRNAISFRKSEAVELADEAAFMDWALKNRDDFITYGKPSVNKTELKKALKAGDEIEGAELVVKQNIQLR